MPSVPGRGARGGEAGGLPGGLAGLSSGRGGQLDGGIMAQGSDGFQGHVASAVNGPFVVLLKQDSTGETSDGGLVGEDADDVGAAPDLAVEALQRVGRRELGGGSLGKLIYAKASSRPGRSGRRASALWGATGRRLRATALRRHRVVLGEGSGDERPRRRGNPASVMHQRVVHELQRDNAARWR